MHTFEFIRPADQAGAIATAAQSKTAQQGADVRFLGGGTTLIDLMKLNVETPARLVDINRLPLDKIEDDPRWRAAASALQFATQIWRITRRCSAIIRCYRRPSFKAPPHRSATWPLRAETCCSERAACTSATLRWHATSASPAADARRSPATTARLPSSARASTASPRNPSDMCVAMAALEATVHIQGPKGSRAIRVRRFPSAARRHAASRNCAGTRRSDHARHAAATNHRKQAAFT